MSEFLINKLKKKDRAASAFKHGPIPVVDQGVKPLEAPAFWYIQTTLKTVPSSQFYKMTIYLEIMFFVVVK